MKDGIVLHPEHGLNPSIELCIVCGEEMGIALLGNNIKGQAPHHICTGEICDNCKKIIDDGGCFIIEVEDGSDFATTEMLIPEGSEHLFKDIYTAKADELYHHVLDKFGWAWRDPKYKSETELCAMLKWAKEKGLTIEELSI